MDSRNIAENENLEMTSDQDSLKLWILVPFFSVLLILGIYLWLREFFTADTPLDTDTGNSAADSEKTRSNTDDIIYTSWEI